MKKTVLFFMLFLLVNFFSYGQLKTKETSARKIDKPVIVDGFLSEPSWKKAPQAGDFIQFQPERGSPASLNTEVKILYDDNFVYFGFLCYDPEPDKIAASITKRDAELKK